MLMRVSKPSCSVPKIGRTLTTAVVEDEIIIQGRLKTLTEHSVLWLLSVKLPKIGTKERGVRFNLGKLVAKMAQEHFLLSAKMHPH